MKDVKPIKWFEVFKQSDIGKDDLQVVNKLRNQCGLPRVRLSTLRGQKYDDHYIKALRLKTELMRIGIKTDKAPKVIQKDGQFFIEL